MCARSVQAGVPNIPEETGGLGRRIAMARTNPFTFLQQVRAETAKVVWPTRNETLVSLIMVVVFVILASIFLFTADAIWSFLVGLILNVGDVV